MSIENLIEKFVKFISSNSKKTIILVFIILIIPISYIPNVKLDTSIVGLLKKEDSTLVVYDKLRRQFGRDEKIIIGIESDDIFSLEFFNTLKNIHTEIEDTVPYIEKVTSLYNVRNTRGENDELKTDDLMSPFPLVEDEVSNIKQTAMNSALYKNLFISVDGKMTTIIVETNVFSQENEGEEDIEASFDEDISDEKPKVFLTEQENTQAITAIRNIIQKYRTNGLNIYIAGSPVLTESLTRQLMSDMMTFTGSVFFIIMLFLYLIYRRISVIAYSLLIVFLSLLVTVGLMGVYGSDIKLPTQILPSLLLAVSMGASVHIFSIFYDRFDLTGNKDESIIYAFKHSGWPVIITSFTTALGIGSFMTSSVAPIADLGLFGSIGILVSLILILFLLPALLSISKIKLKHKDKKIYDNFMLKVAKFTIDNYKAILGTSFMIIVISLFLASKIELSHNMLLWFPKTHSDRISTNTIDEAMSGSITIEVLIDTGKTDGWKDAKYLEKLNTVSLELEEYVDQYSYIGKVISLPIIVKETNRALHENKETFYTIPTNKELIAQELFLFETSGTDDLEDFVDSEFKTTKVSIKLPWIDAMKSVDMLNYISNRIEREFPNEKIEVTGMMQLLIHVFSSSVSSAVQSYIQAIFAITLIMILIFRNMKIGFVSMIPNLMPIVIGLSLMYITDIPLDMFTLLIGSIAIGLAVDDTIHFIYNFKKYYLQSNDHVIAIEKTFLSAGKAMVTTTIILSLGFFAYMMAEMSSIQNFGFLTGVVIIIALFADIFLAPALMILISKRGWVK